MKAAHLCFLEAGSQPLVTSRAALSPVFSKNCFRKEDGGLLELWEAGPHATSCHLKHARTAINGVTQTLDGSTAYWCEGISQDDDAGVAPLSTSLIHTVRFNVPHEWLAEFDAWYEQEHVPILMAAPEWRAICRFSVLEGGPPFFNRMAIHYLSDASAFQSPVRAQARATEWRARLSKHAWFNEGVYVQYTREGK